MADDSLRTAVEGVSPPEKDKHQFFIDVQPVIEFFSLRVS
jgi:scavenger receptor class B, member 1